MEATSEVDTLYKATDIGVLSIVVEPAESNRNNSFSSHVRWGERGAPVLLLLVLLGVKASNHDSGGST
jgi:hypothetical protein